MTHSDAIALLELDECGHLRVISPQTDRPIVMQHVGAEKLLSALRYQFGGHEEKAAAKMGGV